MTEKYDDCLFGILDKCSICNGFPYYTRNSQGYIILCNGCDQCMGPAENKNPLGWDWNKEQRKLKNGKKKKSKTRKSK